MNKDQRFIELWNDYLEGELDEAGVAELQQLLASDSRMVEAAADTFRTHRLLGLNAQDSETRHEEFVRATMAMLPADGDNFVNDLMRKLPDSVPTRARPSHWVCAVVVSAAAMLLLACFLFFSTTGNPEVARITGLNGPVQWTGEGGRVEDITRVGHVLHGGTLESLSADSWAELQFRDETTVTVSGRSLLTLSDQEQKVLRLRYGNVSADVTPQPTGHPMLVHTPSADLQVLGTRFNVDAQAETTMLTVNEGSVRFKRLTDGKSVNVPADHQAMASLDAQNGLAATPRAAGVSTWQSNLKRDVTHGKWVSGFDRIAKRLKKAVAMGEVSKAEAIAQYKQAVTLDDLGSVWAMPVPFGTLVSLRVSGWSAAPVVATSKAKFRVRGKVHIDMPTGVELGISTCVPDGGFAGKYSVSLTADDLCQDGDTFDVTLPLDRFRGKDLRFAASPFGKLIRDWWCVTNSKKAKLEITSVELIE